MQAWLVYEQEHRVSLLFTAKPCISVSTMHICNCHLEATALMSLLLSAPHHALMLHSFSGYMECRTGRVTLIHSDTTSRAQRYTMLINVVWGCWYQFLPRFVSVGALQIEILVSTDDSGCICSKPDVNLGPSNLPALELEAQNLILYRCTRYLLFPLMVGS